MRFYRISSKTKIKMTPSARTIWGSKRKIFRGQYNIGARGQFALDFPGRKK